MIAFPCVKLLSPLFSINMCTYNFFNFLGEESVYMLKAIVMTRLWWCCSNSVKPYLHVAVEYIHYFPSTYTCMHNFTNIAKSFLLRSNCKNFKLIDWQKHPLITKPHYIQTYFQGTNYNFLYSQTSLMWIPLIRKPHHVEVFSEYVTLFVW